MRSVSALVLLLALTAAPAARGDGETGDGAKLPVRLLESESSEDLASSFEPVIVEFREDLETLERAGELPFSDEWFDTLDPFLEGWEKRLDLLAVAARNADAKPVGAAPQDRLARTIDWILLREHVRHRRSQIAFDRARLADCTALAPFAKDLVRLEISRRKLSNVPPKDASVRLDAAKKALDDVRAKVEKGIGKKAGEIGADAMAAAPAAALRTAGKLDSLRGVLKKWFDDRNGFEPEFAWWARKPWESLDGALDGYAKLLREKIAGVKEGGDGPPVGDPIGEEALKAELAHEFISYSPQEVLDIAEREFAWCRAEAKKAAAEMGCGDDWRKALEKVKADTAEPGRQDELVAAQAKEAIAFVTAKDLVTIPGLCRDTWTLHMIPEGAQRFTPYAYYSGEGMGVAYPSSDMDHGRKLESMRGNNEHFSRIVTPHELIPGHHLQLFQASRNRPYRSMFRTPFLVEGWALYWEMRLWDLGWARSPEDRIGMLFWRMHRCARIVVSLKFHLGQMTPEQMIDYLVKEVGHEKDGATSEVRRYVSGGYGPLYQAAYMLGGLQLRALQRELVGGRKMTERAFHDEVLRQNSIPVRLIAAALRRETMIRSGPDPWKFAE